MFDMYVNYELQLNEIVVYCWFPLHLKMISAKKVAAERSSPPHQRIRGK